ncbi:MAG TPA: SDR family oxidoreductase [Candidatus Binataceae bacterium]|jgi:NAD(P)-dependent dehydrogenase (short-subunit alcohol dehydrogenase family)|nr:SDR family oxidoreductase [Candidatus Binataceae bacterium]
MKLKGKVALVTGASRGIGKRTALKLAAEGADVVLTARTVEDGTSRWPGSLDATAREIESQGVQALAVKCDLTLRSEVESLCEQALRRFGHVDLLINNARYVGPGGGTFDPFMKITFEGWEKTMAANLMAPVIAARFLMPAMIERGGGVIACVTSGVATLETDAQPGQGSTSVAYATSKAALNRLVLGLAKEGRTHNIAVVAVDPGFTLTEKFAMATESHGFDTSEAHSMDVPACTIQYLCTCANPLDYTGKVIVAEEFVHSHHLL